MSTKPSPMEVYLGKRKELGRHKFELEGLKFEVFEDVHDPSIATSSQYLAQNLEIPNGAYVCDMCAGSGVQGILALTKGASRADFVEKNPLAKPNILTNLKTHGFKDRARVYVSDVFDSVPSTKYDVILLNSPGGYTTEEIDNPIHEEMYDPHHRLLAKFFKNVGDYMAEGAYIQMVFGDIGNNNVFQNIIQENNFEIASEESEKINDRQWQLFKIIKKTS